MGERIAFDAFSMFLIGSRLCDQRPVHSGCRRDLERFGVPVKREGRDMAVDQTTNHGARRFQTSGSLD